MHNFYCKRFNTSCMVFTDRPRNIVYASKIQLIVLFFVNVEIKIVYIFFVLRN